MRRGRRVLCAAAALLAAGLPAGVAPAGAPPNYRDEMVELVRRIAARARATGPDFGVFPQNGAGLGAQPAYLETVTGIGQEDLHYGYRRDGVPTPPVFTRALRAELDRFRAARRLVLTIDYPFRGARPVFDRAARKRIRRAYRLSRKQGYVPYATVRGLDRLVVSPGFRPSPNRPPIAAWSAVREWGYQLQPSRGQSRADFLAGVGRSGFDMVVMDYSFDGGDPRKWSAVEVADLKRRLGGKLVAYLSIGEAEDYRYYWKPEWDRNRDGVPEAGAPPWLARGNPDWKGNYKVRYWDPAWQEIVLGYLDRIRAQGFDGVYLDLVDAYEYFEERRGRGG